jgi:hypothetical protein
MHPSIRAARDLPCRIPDEPESHVARNLPPRRQRRSRCRRSVVGQLYKARRVRRRPAHNLRRTRRSIVWHPGCSRRKSAPRNLASCSAFRQGIRVTASLSSLRHRRERPLTPRAHRVVRRSYAVGIFFLSALVVSVVCLAHASPPDPTWIPGIYDHGDFDDAVLALLSIDGVTISPSAAQGSDGTWQVLPSPAGSFDPSHSFDLPPSRSPPIV